jgi:hypothetical protein
MNGGNCLCPFLVNFGLPAELVCKTHCFVVKSIYLFVFLTSPLYLLFLFGGLWAPEMNVFFFGF